MHKPFSTASKRIFKFGHSARHALPGLDALKTSLELLSKAGSAVPPLQAVADTLLKIVECAEVAKKNRRESKELVKYAGKIVEAIIELYPSIENGTFGHDQCETYVAELHKTLVEISLRMQELTRSGGLIRRFFRKTGHSEAIASSRQALDGAVTIFQIKSTGLNLQLNRCIMAKLQALARTPRRRSPSAGGVPRTDTGRPLSRGVQQKRTRVLVSIKVGPSTRSIFMPSKSLYDTTS